MNPGVPKTRLALLSTWRERCRAAARNAGRVAIGHARFEWIQLLKRSTVKLPLGSETQSWVIVVATSAGHIGVKITGFAGKIGDWFAGIVREHRLELGHALTADRRAVVAAGAPAVKAHACSLGTSEPKTWLFPGETRALVAGVHAGRGGAIVGPNAATAARSEPVSLGPDRADPESTFIRSRTATHQSAPLQDHPAKSPSGITYQLSQLSADEDFQSVDPDSATGRALAMVSIPPHGEGWYSDPLDPHRARHVSQTGWSGRTRMIISAPPRPIPDTETITTHCTSYCGSCGVRRVMDSAYCGQCGAHAPL